MPDKRLKKSPGKETTYVKPVSPGKSSSTKKAASKKAAPAKKKPAKKSYRTRNWREYNASLVQRGSITFWLDEHALKNWHKPPQTGKRGRPQEFSDEAIQCILMIRSIYHLPLRAAEGFVASFLAKTNINLKCPDYTTVCVRQKTLKFKPPQRLIKSDEPLHVVIDSTGLKVYGEGEWKVRQHDWAKRRTWRKLHIAVNEKTHEILSVTVTTNDFKDSEVLPDLLEQIKENIQQASADGGYDTHEVYEYIEARGAKAVIPPRHDAVIKRHGNCAGPPLPRDEVLRSIRKKGRAEWKKQSGYHRRSLSETAMYRFKTIFGDKLHSRTFNNQTAEIFIKCIALNKITSLGMPQTYPA